MRKYLDLIVVTVVLTFGAAMLTYVDAGGDRKSSKPREQRQDEHKDASGRVPVPQTTPEKAVEKDRTSSEHLGAGEGTSSGTGSGKMQSGSGR
jgi:hypothetical protein